MGTVKFVGDDEEKLQSGDWLRTIVNVLRATELYNYEWLKDKYYVIHIFPNKKFFSKRQECCRGLTTEGKKVLASITGPNISIRLIQQIQKIPVWAFLSCIGFIQSINT